MSDLDKDFDPWDLVTDEELEEVSEPQNPTADLGAEQSEGSGSLEKEDSATKPESTVTKFEENSLSGSSEEEKLRETKMQEAAAVSEKAKKEHDELVCQLEAAKKQLAEERATQAELKKTREEQEELARQLEATRKQLEEDRVKSQARTNDPPPLPSNYGAAQDREGDKPPSPKQDEGKVKINRDLFNR